MKFCSKCKKEYPSTFKYFSPNLCNRDGLSSWCRYCKRQYDKIYDSIGELPNVKELYDDGRQLWYNPKTKKFIATSYVIMVDEWYDDEADIGEPISGEATFRVKNGKLIWEGASISPMNAPSLTDNSVLLSKYF